MTENSGWVGRDRTRGSDRIALRGLRVRGYHGVFEHERSEGQDFVVDVVLDLDTSAAARSDDLADTVDYGAIASRIAAIIGGEPVNLLETLAQRIATACLIDVRVQSVDVAVHKPGAPIPLAFDDVVVTITRARSDATTRAVLGLGANLGERATALQRAIDMVSRSVRVVAVSAIFETAPVGGPAQPDFYNAVALVDTELSATELLAVAHTAEDDAGRVRRERWGPRTLDVDIVSFGDERSDDPTLTLPHPRAHERAFVLLPWHDVDPGAVLPGHGAVAALVDTVDVSGVRRLTEPVLRVHRLAEGEQ